MANGKAELQAGGAYESFFYHAASWNRARRMVPKVEFYCGEVLPCVRFIVTNLTPSDRAVVRFYDKRGKAEQRIQRG